MTHEPKPCDEPWEVIQRLMWLCKGSSGTWILPQSDYQPLSALALSLGLFDWNDEAIIRSSYKPFPWKSGLLW